VPVALPQCESAEEQCGHQFSDHQTAFIKDYVAYMSRKPEKTVERELFEGHTAKLGITVLGSE
jgi:hypothetical protein